jgi:hypothetical protein
MGIVKTEKRGIALKLVKDLRVSVEAVMRQADGLQATLESLELELGLANEGEQANRDSHLVLHYPEGSEVGHTLDECTDDCEADAVINELEDEPELTGDHLQDEDKNG